MLFSCLSIEERLVHPLKNHEENGFLLFVVRAFPIYVGKALK